MNAAALHDLNSQFPPHANEECTYIYALLDPETQEIRYIGKSIRPVERLTNHMNSRERCHRTNWLASLKKKGLRPELVILERIHGEWPWQFSERFWIAYGRKMGWPLTNGTDGGDGVVGISGESLHRMREAWKGRKHKPESLTLIGAASRRRKHSSETKARMSLAHRGRNITWGDTISAALRKLSESDVASIQNRLAAGELGIALAREYGVHRTTISKIKKGTYYAKNH